MPVLAIAAIAHPTLRAVRVAGQHRLSNDALLRRARRYTPAGPITSPVVFLLYSGAIGLALHENRPGWGH